VSAARLKVCYFNFTFYIQSTAQNEQLAGRRAVRWLIAMHPIQNIKSKRKWPLIFAGANKQLFVSFSVNNNI